MTTTADIDKNLRRADLSVPERAEHLELRAIRPRSEFTGSFREIEEDEALAWKC